MASSIQTSSQWDTLLARLKDRFPTIDLTNLPVPLGDINRLADAIGQLIGVGGDVLYPYIATVQNSIVNEGKLVDAILGRTQPTHVEREGAQPTRLPTTGLDAIKALSLQLGSTSPSGALEIAEQIAKLARSS